MAAKIEAHWDGYRGLGVSVTSFFICTMELIGTVTLLAAGLVSEGAISEGIKDRICLVPCSSPISSHRSLT
jgi:hypothetical protein